MKLEYYWTFRIETSRFGGVLGPSCDYVTDENREAWQRLYKQLVKSMNGVRIVQHTYSNVKQENQASSLRPRMASTEKTGARLDRIIIGTYSEFSLIA